MPIADGGAARVILHAITTESVSLLGFVHFMNIT